MQLSGASTLPLKIHVCPHMEGIMCLCVKAHPAHLVQETPGVSVFAEDILNSSLLRHPLLFGSCSMTCRILVSQPGQGAESVESHRWTTREFLRHHLLKPTLDPTTIPRTPSKHLMCVCYPLASVRSCVVRRPAAGLLTRYFELALDRVGVDAAPLKADGGAVQDWI